MYAAFSVTQDAITPSRSKALPISASRSASYVTFDIYDLFRLDLPAILGEAGSAKPTLVATWLTNKPKYRRFVIEKLFPAWQITLAADEWYWVKVTTEGEAIFSLGTSSRKSYEGVCTY